MPYGISASPVDANVDHQPGEPFGVFHDFVEGGVESAGARGETSRFCIAGKGVDAHITRAALQAGVAHVAVAPGAQLAFEINSLEDFNGSPFLGVRQLESLGPLPVKGALDVTGLDERVCVMQRLDHCAEECKQLFRLSCGSDFRAIRPGNRRPVDAAVFEEAVVGGEGGSKNFEIGHRIVCGRARADVRAGGGAPEKNFGSDVWLMKPD